MDQMQTSGATRHGLRWALLALASAWVLAAGAQAALPVYPTRYYVLNTDLDPNGVQEVTMRITLMAEEYQRRTQGFAGQVRDRLPFYVFTKRADYIAAGGMPGSAGVFTGHALAAVLTEAKPEFTWHTIQHEGFHQFVHATMGDQIPVWANEGMAEYFGEGRFTGDRFIVGLIPPERLARIQKGIKEAKFRSLKGMMTTSHDLWNSKLAAENYDQAWSMVQFLAHGDHGRYEQPFNAFLKDVSRQMDWERAWQKNFGNDVVAFEQRWKEYWLGLPDDPTAELRAEAVLSTVTSFYARAASQRQKFATWEEFVAAAAGGQLRAHAKDYLPPTLLGAALQETAKLGAWSLADVKSGWAWPVCTTKSGRVLEGHFKIADGRVKSVSVEDGKPAKKKP